MEVIDQSFGFAFEFCDFMFAWSLLLAEEGPGS